jgi:hypothetical protein
MGLGIAALHQRQDYDRGCDLGACSDSAYDAGHRLATGSDITFGLALTSAAAALVVWLVTRHPAPERPALAGRL